MQPAKELGYIIAGNALPFGDFLTEDGSIPPVESQVDHYAQCIMAGGRYVHGGPLRIFDWS
jgi:hypothetical protein